MKRLIALIVSLTGVASAHPAEAPTKPVPVKVAHIPTHKPWSLVSASVVSAWGRVSWCETHDRWSAPGPFYFGGLGITLWNWVKYGGLEFAPRPDLALPIQQIYVARKIQGSSYVPDQWGCSSW